MSNRVRINIMVDPTTRQAFKRAVVLRDLTMQQVLEGMIEGFIAHPPPAANSEAPDTTEQAPAGEPAYASRITHSAERDIRPLSKAEQAGKKH